MAILETLTELAGKVTGKTPDVSSSYDRLAGTVPSSTLAEGLTHAFQSDETPPFGNMVSNLFNQSSPDQKAGLLNQLLGGLGPGGLSQLAGGGALAGLANILPRSGNVTPAQAQQVSPEQVRVLAENAEKKNPSIVNMAASFYAQHPTLVKSIGAGALALLVSKISQGRK
jgi:hypothetical protein